MIDELAQALIRAEEACTPCPPLSQRQPGLTKAQAYAVQARVTAWRLARGQRPIGKKVGYTSLEAQRLKGLDEPMWAEAFAAQLGADGNLPIGRLLAPRIEPEIAFLLKRDLRGPGLAEADVLAATERLLPSFEVLDSRYGRVDFMGVDAIADSGVHACLVVGSAGNAPAGLDLVAIEGRLERNGAEIARGSGAAVLGHPARPVAWLANVLGAQGRTLRAGELVCSGTLAGAHAIAPGDRLRWTVEGLGVVEVQLVS